jgi:hypothetical protein
MLDNQYKQIILVECFLAHTNYFLNTPHTNYWSYID